MSHSFQTVTALHALVSHWLITSGKVKCSNPGNTDFYDEQMMGIYVGTVAFDKNEVLTESELLQIKKLEGPDYRFPIKTNEKRIGHPFATPSYEVTDWIQLL